MENHELYATITILDFAVLLVLRQQVVLGKKICRGILLLFFRNFGCRWYIILFIGPAEYGGDMYTKWRWNAV